MTIPGRGDLAPLHRHSRIGRNVTVVVVIALLAGGGYAAYNGLSGGSTKTTATQLPLCKHGASPTPRAKAPKLPQSKITVDNASLVTGLATTVAGELRHRGFPIGTVGNAVAVGKGVATISYSKDRLAEATKLAAQIHGAKLTKISGTHSVELDINPKFTALVGKHAAAAAFHATAVSQHLIAPAPTPSPTCRARS